MVTELNLTFIFSIDFSEHGFQPGAEPSLPPATGDRRHWIGSKKTIGKWERRKGREREGKEGNGKERKGTGRKGTEREGKERNGNVLTVSEEPLTHEPRPTCYSVYIVNKVVRYILHI